MSEKGEREVSEKEIDDALEKIMKLADNEKFDDVTHTIKFLARIMFNMRKDYLELYRDYAEFKELTMDVVNPERKGKKDKNEKVENSDTKMVYI